MEKVAIPPRSEESSKEEPQPLQQETPVQQNLLPREPEQSPPPLMVQLGLLQAETDRLRDVLAEKEWECQTLMQQALQRVSEDRTCSLASKPPGEQNWLENTNGGVRHLLAGGVPGFT